MIEFLLFVNSLLLLHIAQCVSRIGPKDKSIIYDGCGTGKAAQVTKENALLVKVLKEEK